jgi:hypothetical protein
MDADLALRAAIRSYRLGYVLVVINSRSIGITDLSPMNSRNSATKTSPMSNERCGPGGNVHGTAPKLRKARARQSDAPSRW